MRPTGAFRDPPGAERGEPIDRLVAVSRVAVRESVDMRARVKRVHDQGSRNSCVGHAFAQGFAVRADVQGYTLDPSASAIYKLAIELESPGIVSLPDLGCYPMKAVEGMSDWGVCSRLRVPDDEPIAPPLPIDVLEAGSIAHITGEYRIFGTVDAVRDQIQRALSAGHPVVWARDIGPEYMGWRGGVYGGESTISGGHAGCLVGFNERGVLDVGSYGLGHGEAGYTRNSWDFVLGSAVHFLMVITASPAEVL